MFRGDVLAGAGDGDWVIPHRARLEEARMKLIETGCSARLRLGDAGDVIGELEAAVAAYPFQESLWVLLITALYRAGRQADALAAYQRVRTALADELGLDPGPQLQQLEQQILIHDATLDAAGPADDARRRTDRRQPAVDRRPSSSVATPSSLPLSELLADAAGSSSRRSRRRRQDGARDRDGRALSHGVGEAASGWPDSKRRRRRTTSSTR